MRADLLAAEAWFTFCISVVLTLRCCASVSRSGCRLGRTCERYRARTARPVAPRLRAAGFHAAGRVDPGVVVFGLLGSRLRLQPLLHVRIDALVVAQIEAGHDFCHVLHGPDHLPPFGIEVDLGVPGEQRHEFFAILIAIAVARTQ